MEITTDESSAEALFIARAINRLNKIAKRNKDKFIFRVKITEDKRGSGPLNFDFNVAEEADGHTFVAGCGEDLIGSVMDALNGLPDALVEWGYKDVSD